MRTFLELMASYINGRNPDGGLLQLAHNLIQSNDIDRWSKIELIYNSNVEIVKFEMCQPVTLDFVQKLKPTLIEIILWHRPAQPYEMTDDEIIKYNDSIYPVFQTIYNHCGLADQQARLAKMIIDYYRQNPDRQDEIKALIAAQAEKDWFYGDSREPGRSASYNGSEFVILSNIVDIASIPLD